MKAIKTPLRSGNEERPDDASFERVCLSVWLHRYYPDVFRSYSIPEDSVGDYLDPSSWRCSMVASAYLGLPLTLAGVGTALNLEQQKMSEGKALIPDLESARNLVLSGDMEALELFYEDVPDTLSQLIRTAFVPKPGYKFIVADFSAIEARVIAWLAGEIWRMDAFARGDDIYCASASRIFGVPVVKHGINGHLRQKGKVAELACGYGGSVGAMKAMGGSNMTDEELKQIVTDWRQASPHIVQLWWDVESAAIKAVRQKTIAETHDIRFSYESGFLFIELPSGRRLAYVKPRIEENRFGNDSITYFGVGAAKRWERMETYSGKLVENIVQGIARDLLFYSMRTLSHCFIVGHIHDEMIIECSSDVSLPVICEQMARTPDWAKGLILRADGYECEFYKKD